MHFPCNQHQDGQLHTVPHQLGIFLRIPKSIDRKSLVSTYASSNCTTQLLPERFYIPAALGVLLFSAPRFSVLLYPLLSFVPYPVLHFELCFPAVWYWHQRLYLRDRLQSPQSRLQQSPIATIFIKRFLILCSAMRTCFAICGNQLSTSCAVLHFVLCHDFTSLDVKFSPPGDKGR